MLRILLCICMTASLRVFAQDQMPIVELQRYMTGKVWVADQECIYDSCFTAAENNYYWAEDIFDSHRGYGASSWCFTLSHAFYFKDTEATSADLIVNTSPPSVCVIATNPESTSFTVYYSSGTGEYEMKLVVIDERSFMLSGASWGSTRTCHQFRAIDPSPELTMVIARDAGN